MIELNLSLYISICIKTFVGQGYKGTCYILYISTYNVNIKILK